MITATIDIYISKEIKEKSTVPSATITKEQYLKANAKGKSSCCWCIKPLKFPFFLADKASEGKTVAIIEDDPEVSVVSQQNDVEIGDIACNEGGTL